TKAAPPRVVALSSMGANRTSGLGMITALSLLEQGLRDLISPIAFVRAGGFDLPSVTLDTGLPMWGSDERTETKPSHVAHGRGNGAGQAGAALERGTQTRRRPAAAAR